MAPSAIDAKEAERSAAIADAKQKGNEAASLPAPVTDVALSPSPHSATRPAASGGSPASTIRTLSRVGNRCLPTL